MKLLGITPSGLFQHTAARRRLAFSRAIPSLINLFQHTAARRRLADTTKRMDKLLSFKTQPPEGGWPSRVYG